MYETSQGNGSEPISKPCHPLSSVARPVKTQVLQTPRGKVLMAPVPASSSKLSASSANADLFGRALRTSLASELAALTGCLPRWKNLGTPAGRSWWVLGTPAHLIGANGSGSLLLTCRTTDADRGGRGDLIQAIRGDENAHFKALLLPTPLADQGRHSHRGSARTKPQGRRGADLSSILLATPTARDWRSGKASEATHARNSRPLSEQLQKGAAGTVGRTVLLAVSEWLMGFPPGWLARASVPTATPSSPKSPKQSGGS